MKILVFADVHGNATALKAVLEKEQEFDSVVFLGDAVSPGPQPNETMALMADLDGVFIRGNHEYTMLNPDSTKHWPDGYRHLMEWVYKEFDAASLSRLKSFQKPGEYQLDGHTFVLAHGDEDKDERHVLPNSADHHFLSFSYGNPDAPVLFGHSHVQFEREIDHRVFINPGSVGQNRCGHVCACYGLLIDGTFTAQSVSYDPTPWLDACDRIDDLGPHKAWREWFKQQVLTGYAAGAIEPWLSFNQQGYR